MRISDWISDVCSSDLFNHGFMRAQVADGELVLSDLRMGSEPDYFFSYAVARREGDGWQAASPPRQLDLQRDFGPVWQATWHRIWNERSEEHTSEIQSLMRISYAAFA